MAAATTYFVVEYDNEASGPFVANSTLVTWPGSGSGHIITVIDNGTTGKLHIALLTGSLPTNNQTLTQGATTADANGPAPNGDAEALLYPAYAREDLALSAVGNITWTGPATGATHSFFFDGQTSNFVVGEILTFSGGQQCEVVTIVSDAGASGEVDVRWITNLNTLEFPDDNDTFTGDIAGDGALNGAVHARAYNPLNLHRLLADLNDDSIYAGDDVLSVYNATPSARDTDQIVRLLGDVNINNTVAQHMYGGSVSQYAGADLFSGLDIQITDSDGGTNPIVIQDDGIVTAYWENAHMPDSIAGRVRLMIKTREDGVDIDGKRVTGKLLRYGDSYFSGSTTLGQASTALALFSSPDGNNQTAAGTVAGAPYNTIVQTFGYQTIDYNNGNGAQPYAYEMDFGSATSAQAYERTKYIQRRGTVETLFGRNAQLFTGVTLNFAFDANTGAWNEGASAEEAVWGTVIPVSLGGAGAAQVWQVDDSVPTFVDQTTGFNDATSANCTPFPASEAIDDYFAIGFERPFSAITIDSAGGTAGVGGVVAWEYWNGSAWTAVSGLTDDTSGFTVAADAQEVSWTMPSDWKANTLNSVTAFYVRARVTTVYSTNPVLDQGFIGNSAVDFTQGEVVVGATSGARGRILWNDATVKLVVAQDSGATAFTSTEEIAGASSGAVAVSGSVVTNSNAGSMQVLAISGSGATGNLYGQRTRGVAPANDQIVYGVTSGQTCAVNVTVQTRVVNNQYIGNYTGSAYNPANFGIAIDNTDAIAADLFTDLLGATQQPPNNQSGTVTGGEAGDRLFVFNWDGTSLDINGDPTPVVEMTLNTGLSSGVSTSVDVGTGQIPANTPQTGWLRVAADSDGQYYSLEYSAHNGDDTFTLVGTSSITATAGNGLYRAFIDKVWTTTGVPESYTAVQSTTNQVGIYLYRGGANPIKPFKGSATFGTTGFTSPVQRIADA